MALNTAALQRAWSELRESLADSGDALFLERGLVHGPVGVSAVIRVADAKAGILLRVRNDSAASRWNAQKLAGVYFENAFRESATQVFPILAADEESQQIFATFVADVAEVIESGAQESVQWARITERIGLWKRFFTRRKGGLTEEEQRGLIGELIIVGALIRERGLDIALDAWKGPAGELHDFHLSEYRVEAKTWTNKSRAEIHISDPAQLVVDHAWPVWIAAIELTHNARGHTIGDHVAQLREAMGAAHRLLFDAMLADAGYLAIHASSYCARYTFRDAMWFCVRDGFPIIDRVAIPAAVTSLKYALSLPALDSFAGPSPLGRLTD